MTAVLLLCFCAITYDYYTISYTIMLFCYCAIMCYSAMMLLCYYNKTAHFRVSNQVFNTLGMQYSYTSLSIHVQHISNKVVYTILYI